MEAELIQRAQSGDGEAYETLMRTHQEAVFRFAYLFVGDTADAEDITQDVFIRAYHNLHQFDLSRPMRPWLLSITANTAKNRRRALGRYWSALKRLIPQMMETATIETRSTEKLEAQALWEAVQKLSSIDQEVIYLRYFMQLSVSETAEVLKVEQGTVKSRLSRALTRLRGVVKQDFPLLYEGRQS